MAEEAAPAPNRDRVMREEAVSGPLSRFGRRQGSRALRAAAVLVAAVVLLELAGLAAWRYFSELRLGHIDLTNQGPPLTIQVLSESDDEPLGQPIDLVKHTTLSLPDGDYRLRVTGTGRLGRTFRVDVNRGETITQEISLEEGRLLGRELAISRWSHTGEKPREEPMPFAMVTRALELTPGKFDIVEFTGKNLIRRDGSTGEAVWDVTSPRFAYDPGRDPARWVQGIDPTRWAIQFVEPAIDLDGDGTRDVLATVDNTYAFLALSGKDGSMLWNFVAEHDGPGGPQPEGPRLPGPIRQPNRQGGLIGPVAIGDVDGDGTPDLIASMSFSEFPSEVERRIGKPPTNMTPTFTRRVIQAISGRSGRSIWMHPLDSTFRDLKFRYGDRPAVLVRGRRSSVVAILDDTNWIALDPATGRPRSGPFDLGFAPVRPLQHADLDGDGEPEIVALGAGPTAAQQSLAIFSTGDGRQRWTATVNAKYESPYGGVPPREWPWLVDLDRDGRTEVIIPEAGPMPPASAFRGVQMLDGGSGRPRWVRPMQPDTKAEDDVLHLLEAPDLDGDGTRELIAMCRFAGRNAPAPGSGRQPRSEPERLLVDALSGRDGHPLWSWHSDLPENKFTYLWAPRWWARGRDGWPLLAVPVGSRYPDGADWTIASSNFHPPVVYVLEATTGRPSDEATGISQAAVADLDGDGLDDLWGEADGQLRAFRGEPPEAWRALGLFAPALRANSPWGWNVDRLAADLDGDGVADTLVTHLSTPGDAANDPTGSRTAVARSGRDGRVLWKTVLDPPWIWFLPEHGRSYSLGAFPAPAGDLEGDGTPDVLVQKQTHDEAEYGRRPATLPLQALRGRDGQKLWSAGPLPLGFEAHGYSQVTWVEPRVIEPGSPPDLVVLHRSPFLASSPPSAPPSPWAPTQQRLARVSGRTGRIVWDIPLEEKPSNPRPGGGAISPRFADLDGDGALDAAVVVPRELQPGQSEFDLDVVSLRDGAIRWSHMIPYDGFVNEPPSCEIGRGAEGVPATVFVTRLPATPDSTELIVDGLDGRDGNVLWTWRTGVGKGDGKYYGGLDPIGLDGKGKDSVCVTYSNLRRECGLVLLDARGRERGRRAIPPELVSTQQFLPISDLMMDLDGDGRDEIVVWYDNRVHAWSRDFKELWSLPAPRGWPITRYLPSAAGRPCTLVLSETRAVDGMSGRARWIHKRDETAPAGLTLLDPGDGARRPLLITSRSSPTTCRYALPATPGGDYAPPGGDRVPPGLASQDPRWTRPLPWTEPLVRTIGLKRGLAMVALALVNVAVPLGVLWLAGRRRPWTLRVLMALPVAAAAPLAVFQAIEPLLPVEIAARPVSSKVAFVLATLAGVPIVTYGAAVLSGAARLRWKALAWVVGLSLAASAIIAAAWLWSDRRSMPAIEHYDRSNAYLAVLLGAYAVGILIPVWWVVRATYRILRRPWRRELATS
jgi:hypothetical protein